MSCVEKSSALRSAGGGGDSSLIGVLTAPAAIKAETTSECPFADAMCSAVRAFEACQIYDHENTTQATVTLCPIADKASCMLQGRACSAALIRCVSADAPLEGAEDVIEIPVPRTVQQELRIVLICALHAR